MNYLKQTLNSCNRTSNKLKINQFFNNVKMNFSDSANKTVFTKLYL